MLDYDKDIEKQYEINREYELPISHKILIGGIETLQFRLEDESLK
jgi:hypothetical protein